MDINKFDIGNCVVYLSLQPSNQVSISLMFHENNDIIQNVKDSQCIIVVKDENKEKNISVDKIVNDVLEMLKQRGIMPLNQNVNVLVLDSADQLKLKDVSTNSQFKYVISDMSNQMKNENSKDVDGKAPFEGFYTANIVQKLDNGNLKSYINRKGDSNNIGYMLEGVQLVDLYTEFKRLSNDSQFRANITGLNEEQVANILLDSIASSKNLKKYYMEGSTEIKKNNSDLKEDVVSDLTLSKEGVGNTEIGVIENSSEFQNRYQIVEEKGNQLNIGSPSVVSNQGFSSGVISNGDFSSSVSLDGSDSNIYQNDNLNSDNQESFDFSEQKNYIESRDNVKRRILTKPSINGNNSGFISLIAYLIVALFILFILAIIIVK